MEVIPQLCNKLLYNSANMMKFDFNFLKMFIVLQNFVVITMFCRMVTQLCIVQLFLDETKLFSDYWKKLVI